MTENKNNIAVLGGGSFGTVVANMIATNGHGTTLWMRDVKRAEECALCHENRHYLPGYSLDPGLQITADLSLAVSGAELIFLSVPGKGFREVCRLAAPHVKPEAMIVSTAKGIEAETFKLMSEIVKDEFNLPITGVISGPNLAHEIARRELTATVVASADQSLCDRVQGTLSTSFFRVYTNRDMYGVELAGALKNIYAIAAGIADAMNLGQNTISMLITRSLAEMARFASKLGADPMTFIGLSGVGDLFVTCTSPLSRNFRIGQALGRGKTLDQAISEVGQVAEGINTTRSVKLKADQIDVYMPLATALYNVMYNNASVREVVQNMMVSEQSEDVEFRIQ